MFITITKISVIPILFLFPISISNNIVAQESSKYDFEYKDLGVHISKSNLSPYHQEIDTKNWETFSMPNEGLEFSYPSNTCIETKEYESRIRSSCDTIITISFHFRIYVELILSNESFGIIADKLGFEKNLSYMSKTDSIWSFGAEGTDWVEEFNGDKWKGLHGWSPARQYGEEGYIGLTDQEQIFFIMERANNCNIIFTYYSGPYADLCEESKTPESSFDEIAFFEMVSSLTLIND